MTYFPKYLKTYPNMHSSFPFHLSMNRLSNGYPAHRHDFLEFSYVVEGSGSETINGINHRMEPGTFTFVLPYQVHELFTDPGSTLVLYNCMFSMDLLMEKSTDGDFSALLDDEELLPSYAQLTGSDMECMDRLLDQMYREYGGSGRWRETVILLKLKEALVYFDRFRRGHASDPATPSRPAVKQGYPVWPIIHYIHRNYQEDLSLSDLAKKFPLSVSRISEVIKQTTGQTFVHFLHDLRIRHACGLLVSTEMSVAEIALEVGYGSYKTFSRIFRESKGVVPTEYRKLKA
ncbi:AraC family transcriptional regulator [Paenibacillus hamazuiensis]|uniref:AraC family transcriptional regulator n=1 Tax=Paenibacillus hamazuiensis TaxID=2936508 RepID=UPI002010B76E|nr:AraC family transcriptional regulator [Paenibacillus hamazuiensis]